MSQIFSIQNSIRRMFFQKRFCRWGWLSRIIGGSQSDVVISKNSNKSVRQNELLVRQNKNVQKIIENSIRIWCHFIFLTQNAEFEPFHYIRLTLQNNSQLSKPSAKVFHSLKTCYSQFSTNFFIYISIHLKKKVYQYSRLYKISRVI